MARKCTVCSHPQREAIDAALVANEPYRAIALRENVGAMALQRHKAEHLAAHLAQAHDAQEAASADDLLAQVRDLQARTYKILDKAERSDRLTTALQAIREARGNLELLGKLAGELQQEGTVNITISTEWVTLRGAILVALGPYPEARGAVVEALSHVSA